MKNLTDILAYFRGPTKEEKPEPLERDRCLYCDVDLSESSLYKRLRVCHSCGFHYSLSAHERVELLADSGTFKEINRSLTSLDPLSFSGRGSYRRDLFEARKRTGLTDAVLTGTCSIGGTNAMLAVLDFGFMGGSMGCVVGEKMALAFEQAAKRRLPLVTVVASGGSRMQEGVLSLVQMAKTAAAAKQLSAAGVPFISVLANPATGQVYASFANLGDITIAEPRALVGFAPLRVVEQATGKPLPAGSHTAEYQLKHGMIDMVVERIKLRENLAALLDLLTSRYILTTTRKREPYPTLERPKESPWETVQLARHEQRPTALDYIRRMAASFVEIHGDRIYGDDPAVVCGLADLGGEAVVIIGQERGRGEEAAARHEGRLYPEGFRKAQRAMALAAKFRLPLVSLIDTPGAYAGLEAEERGIGSALAMSLAMLADLPVPTLSVIIGEGGSEGALALGVADRILMLENAIYSVMSPETAASLVYRDESKASEMASALRLTAFDCRELGVVDLVVPEPPGGAHEEPEEAARQLKGALLAELVELRRTPAKKLLKNRYAKYRRMGEFSHFFKAAVTREMTQVQDVIAQRMEALRDRFPFRGRSDGNGQDEDVVVP